MGYCTNFYGRISLSRKLTDEEFKYINLISKTRRMKRDVNKLMEIYKGKHGYPFATEKTPEAIYGNEGEYFAMDDGQSGQKQDESIIDYNTAPGKLSYDNKSDFNTIWNENERRSENGECQPGLWCQWIVVEDDEVQYLEWDGGEKFYNYIEWLKYLINHFFSKWGVFLNGEIEWQGEDSKDLGKIIVVDNNVTVKVGKIVYD